MKRSIILFLSIVIVLSCFSSCSVEEKTLSLDGVKRIGEFATIECYYHNVAKVTKEKNNIFQKDRKLWIEYEGVATIGVDMSLVTTEIKEDKIIITMPSAKLFDIDKEDKTFKIIESGEGIIKNKISAEEQEDAIEKAQAEMKRNILENESLFFEAEERAKNLIENYINKLSESIGKEYTIEWKTAKNA